MVFIVNSAFCLALIALALGVFLLARSGEDRPGKKLLKVVGYIVAVGAILSLLCTLVNTFCLKKTLTAPCPLIYQQKSLQPGPDTTK